MPRRTMIMEAPYSRESWELAGTLTGIGGTIMFVAIMMFCAIVALTILRGARTSDLTIPVAETIQAPGTSGWELKLDRIRLWLVLAVVLILLAYGPFLVGYLPPHLDSPGFGPPFI